MRGFFARQNIGRGTKGKGGGSKQLRGARGAAEGVPQLFWPETFPFVPRPILKGENTTPNNRPRCEQYFLYRGAKIEFFLSRGWGRYGTFFGPRAFWNFFPPAGRIKLSKFHKNSKNVTNNSTFNWLNQSQYLFTSHYRFIKAKRMLLLTCKKSNVGK